MEDSYEVLLRTAKQYGVVVMNGTVYAGDEEWMIFQGRDWPIGSI